MSRRITLLIVFMLLNLSAIVCNLGVVATEPPPLPPPSDTSAPPAPTDTPVPADTEAPAEKPATQTVKFVVINSSNTDVCFLYLSTPDSGRGADQLAGNINWAGGSFTLENILPGTYDVQFEPCDTNVEPLEDYGLDLNEDFEYALVSV